MNSVFGVNSNPKIIFLLFLVFIFQQNKRYLNAPEVIFFLKDFTIV